MISPIEQRLLAKYKKYRGIVVLFPVVAWIVFYSITGFTSPQKDVAIDADKEPAVVTEMSKELPVTIPEPAKKTSTLLSIPSETSQTKVTPIPTQTLEEEMIPEDSDLITYIPSKEVIKDRVLPVHTVRAKILGKQTVSTKKPYVRMVLLEPLTIGTKKLPKGSEVFAKATFEDDALQFSVSRIRVNQQQYDIKMIVLGSEGYEAFPMHGKSKLKLNNTPVTLQVQE